MTGVRGDVLGSMQPFVCAATFGAGTIPRLPEEIRRLILAWTDWFRCRACMRDVLACARATSAYRHMPLFRNLCASCFSETLL